MATTATASATSRERFARLIFTAGALGEIGVGLLTLAFPQIMIFLLDVPLDAGGLMVTRILGTAVLGLGVTWWLAHKDARGLGRNASGFLIWNLGVGALFAFQALSVARPALPWIVAVGHLAAGLGLLALAPAGIGTTTKSKE